jgi:hypothetical protein
MGNNNYFYAAIRTLVSDGDGVGEFVCMVDISWSIIGGS